MSRLRKPIKTAKCAPIATAIPYYAHSGPTSPTSKATPLRSGSVQLYADYNISFSPENRKSTDILYAKSSQFTQAFDPCYRKKEFSFAADRRKKQKFAVLRQKLLGRQSQIRDSLHKERKLNLAIKAGNVFNVKLPKIQRFSVNEDRLISHVFDEARRNKEHAAATFIQHEWNYSKKIRQLRSQAELELLEVEQLRLCKSQALVRDI